MLHQKREDVAALAASEAVEYLFALRHGKGRCLLVMERTPADMVSTALLELWQELGKHVDNIRGLPNLVDEVVRVQSNHGTNIGSRQDSVNLEDRSTPLWMDSGKFLIALAASCRTFERMEAAKFVDIDGVRIAYRSAGEGKPLVLLHGFTYSSYSFRHNIPILSKFARVVCPDLVGHGKSDKPTGFDYSLKNQAKLIYNFCRTLDLERIDLCGCSMGGALAMQMAISYPDFVERLILVDSAGLDLDVKSPQRIFAIPVVGHIAALTTTIRFRKSTHTRMTLRDDEVIEGELAEYLKELKSFSSLMAGVRNLRANRAFKLAGIGRINQQTLIIWGERDPLFSTDSAIKLTEKIVNSRLILLPGAGHLPNEEKPADFNQVVIDFLLERIPSARGV